MSWPVPPGWTPTPRGAPLECSSVFPYVWRVRTRLPDRFGQRCRVIARFSMNSAHVQFDDGYEVITSRNYLRKASHS